jgi:ribosomal protein S1
MTTREGVAWASFAAQHEAGDVVTVAVTWALPFGALVETVDGIPGLLRGRPGLSVGRTLDARIDAMDATEKRVALSAL